MILQAGDLEAKLRALHLDAQEREEAEYHVVLTRIVRPVEESVAAYHTAAPHGRCAEWAAEHREILQQAAERLREAEPPKWLHVYRDSFLKAITLFLESADCLDTADANQANASAQRAEEALEDAEELAEGLI